MNNLKLSFLGRGPFSQRSNLNCKVSKNHGLCPHRPFYSFDLWGTQTEDNNHNLAA